LLGGEYFLFETVYILSKEMEDYVEDERVYGNSISLSTEMNIAMATKAIEAYAGVIFIKFRYFSGSSLLNII
jgi:hypothetical protein